MNSLKSIKRSIIKARSIAIVCHKNPDGDCIGSLLSLGIGLASLKKRVHMVSQDGVPLKYRSLPGAHKIVETIKTAPDLAITVDCNAKEMLGRPFDIIKKSKDILEIDHHEFREPFGNLSLIDINSASVGELIYRLLRHLKIDITQDIARNILTSIIVETNSFRLPTVKPITFRICDKLLQTGIEYYKFSELIYWSNTKQSALLSGMCMARLKFSDSSKIAWSVVTRKDFAAKKGKDEDVDAVANDILSINTVKIAVLFREKSKRFLRVSLRSKAGINVASLAYRYGGGGHFDSAGCRIANTRQSIEDFIKSCKKLLR